MLPFRTTVRIVGRMSSLLPQNTLNRTAYSTIISQQQEQSLPREFPKPSYDDLLDKPYENIPPVPRLNEPLEQKRARLAYQSRKRGILECDLLLSTFASSFLPSMTAQELADYDHLLDQPDWDIYYWATEKKVVPEHIASQGIFSKLQKHAKNEGKQVRKMPNLS